MKSFSYSKKPEVGKAHVSQVRNDWRVYVYDSITDNAGSATYVSSHRTREEALKTAAEMNDWQWLVDTPIYKPKIDSRFYLGYEMQPWEHVLIHDDKLIIFIWDTREIVKVARNPFVGKHSEDISKYLSKVNDNKKPLAKDGRWLFQSEIDKLPITFKTKKER